MRNMGRGRIGMGKRQSGNSGEEAQRPRQCWKAETGGTGSRGGGGGRERERMSPKIKVRVQILRAWVMGAVQSNLVILTSYGHSGCIYSAISLKQG